MTKLTPKIVKQLLDDVNIVVAFSGSVYMYYSPTHSAKYTIVNSTTNESWGAVNVDDACMIFNYRAELQDVPPKSKLN